jgi:hypothetical protein
MTHRLSDSLHDSQDDEYLEIDQAIKRSFQRSQFKTGGFLQQMLKRGKYGPHETFKDYVVTELRVTEVTAFRLVFAHWAYELFKRHRLKCPLHERQVRPLNRLERDQKRTILAWTRACAQKQKSLPTESDVMREVNRLVIPQKASQNDEGYQKYWADLQLVRAAAKRMSKRLADGELENLLLSDDKINILRKGRIAKAITKLGISFGDHFRYCENYLEEPPEEDW